MFHHISCIQLRVFLLALALAPAAYVWAGTAEPLPGLRAEVAGISGFRTLWDKPIVLAPDGPLKIVDAKVTDRGGAAEWKNGTGAIAFDALNRSLLVRFPDAAEAIAAEMKKGLVITKAEIVFPFRDEELWPVGNSDYIGPDGYSVRKNWGVDEMYRAIRPEWHAVAWALRKPWKADPAMGPTFNANVNGKSFWRKFGAQDETEDRYPRQFGPAEVSHKNPEGRLDVTAAFNDPAFGATPGQRLRAIADNGFLVRKLETYDMRYFDGVYEWGTATGGRAIVTGQPRLELEFEKGKVEVGVLPPPANVSAQKGGSATAVIPPAEELLKLAEQFRKKPEWMPDWQWKRTQELFTLENPKAAEEPFWHQFLPVFVTDRLAAVQWKDGQKVPAKPIDPKEAYEAWVDMLIGRQPRGWSGFESAREMTQWYLYGSALPEPARDAIRRYWTAWLMPDRETAPRDKQRDINHLNGELVHPMVQDDRVGKGPPPNPLKGNFDNYWLATGDWRGNKSFFRSGFNYHISTQNFNTTAMAGALLAGALIGSDRAMADGRHGAETFPLRLYSWTDGSGQEHIDHYYYAVTVSGNKALVDFSQTPFDRLLGQSLMVKNLEELISAYHPGLRAFIAGSSRSSMEFLLGTQDGLQFVLHTLSKEGTLRDVGVKELPGKIKVIGHEVPPRLAARQTLPGPWAPEWVVPMVDEKPLPYLARHTRWNGGQRTAYLGKNYGLFSTDLGAGRFQNLAQWRRDSKKVSSSLELGTLDMRYGINETRFVNTAGGVISEPGSHSTVQEKNKLIFIASPKTWGGGFHGENKNREDVLSLQSSIGLFTLQDKPTWEIFIDGKKVEALPATAKQGQKITIKDGVTYLGIIPLPATDLGRSAEVVLEAGKPQVYDQYQATITPTLVVNSYNYKGDKPYFVGDKEKWMAAGRAYGGFVVEMGDADEFGSFDKFQKHLAGAQLKVDYDDATRTVSVDYRSGEDRLEVASVTAIPVEGQGPDQETGKANLVATRVNGSPFGLVKGIERDTPYAQQGLGRVEKNGAVLEGDTERRMFVLTEPKGGAFSGWNPLPDLTKFNFSVPGGMAITADGTVGLTRVVVHPAANRIEIDSVFKPGQEKESGTARNFRITGSAKTPTIVFNGKTLSKEIVVEGKAWLVPVAGP